jgi:hypothetical protein
MTDDFMDYRWKDIVTPDVPDVYGGYRRKTFVGAAPARDASGRRRQCGHATSFAQSPRLFHLGPFL